MIRHNDLHSVGNEDLWLNAVFLKVSHLLDEVLNAESNTVADDVRSVVVKYSRRKLMQSKLAVVVYDSVAGIAAALKSDYNV